MVDEHPATHDFDAWRAAQDAKRRPESVTLFGADVPVPISISLDLSMRIEEAELDDAEAITECVAELFGEDEFDRWREAGCSLQEFSVLLAWGSARAQGEEVTFDEAAQILARRRGEIEGKAPGNRAERRASKRAAKRRKR